MFKINYFCILLFFLTANVFSQWERAAFNCDHIFNIAGNENKPYTSTYNHFSRDSIHAAPAPIVGKHEELSAPSISFHAGINSPIGSFGNNYQSGSSFGLDLEYLFNTNYALELFLGFDNFDGVAGSTDIDVTHISMNGKRYFAYLIHRYFVQAGTGNYDFDPGSSEFGFNIGAGFQWNQTPHLAFEVTAKYHSINTSGNGSAFFTLHAGTRLRL